MVVAFPEGASFTGEPMAEIQCHGSRAVLLELLTSLATLPDCRMADPGEFTHRAFVNGRMDLSEVEGLADLIAAETSEQRRQAMRIHAGAVSHQTETWREMLIRARSLVELTIDWVDEEVPEDVLPEVAALLERLESSMQKELLQAGPAERMRSGIEVAIIGPPNVGKSSLLNAIAGRDAAITSEFAGTTRDILEVRFDLGGLPVVFLDTAGLRNPGDPIEKLGVERTRRRAAAADLRIVMSSVDTAANEDAAALFCSGDIRVWSKCDLAPGEGEVAISATTQQGVEALLSLLRDRLAARFSNPGILGHTRQRLAVEASLSHVRQCRQSLGQLDAEYAAEELRLAARALDRLIGRIEIEDVLGEIFSSFCLGK